MRHPGGRDPDLVWRCDGRRYDEHVEVTRCCPLCVWRRQFLGFFLADGDMDELEEELKLLLDETKPDHIILLPEVPSGVLQPSGGSGLLDSLPAAPRSPINICEQMKRLTVTSAGRDPAISLLSSKKKTFTNVSFFFLFSDSGENSALTAGDGAVTPAL